MSRLTPVARRLRRDQTSVERLLWSKLCNRGLGGWKFRRQIPIGTYVVDFCCPDGWLVVEIDGGQHTSEDVQGHDQQRTATLEASGYLVVRFWNREVLDNLEGVCATVLNLLQGAPAELDQPRSRATV